MRQKTQQNYSGSKINQTLLGLFESFPGGILTLLLTTTTRIPNIIITSQHLTTDLLLFPYQRLFQLVMALFYPLLAFFARSKPPYGGVTYILFTAFSSLPKT
jgi:hypothetical protein